MELIMLYYRIKNFNYNVSVINMKINVRSEFNLYEKKKKLLKNS